MPSTSNLEEKMKSFRAAVFHLAEKQSASIHAQTSTQKDRELEEYTALLAQEEEQALQNEKEEIEADTTKQISQKVLEYKRLLYKERGEYSDLVFKDARQRLLTYTQSSEYQQNLFDTAKNLGEKYNFADATLQVCGRDLPLADKLTSAYGKPCKVEASSQIELGGLTLYVPTTGLIIDETIDSRLEEQKDWFLEASGFTTEL